MALPCAVLLCCILLAGCAATGHRHGPELRHDGIYQSSAQSDDGDTYWSYLRFYPDGTVIDTSSTGEPADLQPWFNRRMDDPSVGHVSVQGNHLRFSQASKEGTVDYQGTIDGNTLHLASYSHINGHRDNLVYTFVKWKPAASPATDAGSVQP
jgi:hypothetical protein